jgi:hypothetical protein
LPVWTGKLAEISKLFIAEQISRVTAFGASRPLRRIPAIVSFLNPQMVYRGGRDTHR